MLAYETQEVNIGPSKLQYVQLQLSLEHRTGLCLPELAIETRLFTEPTPSRSTSQLPLGGAVVWRETIDVFLSVRKPEAVISTTPAVFVLGSLLSHQLHCK